MGRVRLKELGALRGEQSTLSTGGHLQMATFAEDSNRCSIPYGPEQRPWEDTLSSLAKSPTGELLVTPPTVDPLQLHDHGAREGITSCWYQVPSTGLTEEQHSKAQVETVGISRSGNPNLIGFQQGKSFLHCECANQYLSTHMNNAGDPFYPSPTSCSTKWMERNLLDYYASLWHAKWPHNPEDPESYWGYTLSMGSTEGNLYALWNARNYLSGKYTSASTDHGPCPKYRFMQCKCPPDNPNALTPVVLYSQEAHYTIENNAQVTAVPTVYELGTQKYAGESPLGGEWPDGVPCVDGDAGTGTIDIPALAALVDFFSSKGHPIVVVFNYGTTFKGAYDDVKAAGEALLPILKRNGMYERKLYLQGDDPKAYIVRRGFWFHVDGALGATYAPFLQMAYKNGLTSEQPPLFDFQLDFVSSIVTSGYKWVGCPWPCGIYMTKTGLLMRPLDQSDAIIFSSPASTLASSRNAHSALVWWSYISTHSYEAQVKEALTDQETASYAEGRLKELEAELGQDLWVTRSPASLAICFKKPTESIARKYSLPMSWLCIKGEWRQYTHMYTMDVTKVKVDEFISALKVPGAFPTDC